MPDNAANLDALSGAGGTLMGYGNVAARLLSSGMSINSLRTNDVLRKEEWIQFDQVVVEIARKRLVGIADLFNANLTYSVANAMGTTVLQWEQVSDMEPADISMSGITPGERDRVEWSLKSIPLPIVHKDFNVNIRALEASRRLGQPLDTTQAAMAARLVSERLERILFKGAVITGGGGTIYGYTTAPNRNTGTLSGNWATFPTVTGENIVSDVISMIDAASADNMYGPFMLYVPRSYYTVLANDFKANSDRTIMERIEAIEGIMGVRQSNDLNDGASGEVVLVQMTSDVVDLVDGIQPTTVQWEAQGGMQVNFKILAIQVPRIKDDYNNQSGIVHFTV